MLNRPVEAEIGLYRVEPGIPEVKVELERVTLKVDTGINDEDPTVGAQQNEAPIAWSQVEPRVAEVAVDHW